MFSKKSFFKKNKSFIIFIISLICLLFTRFYGLNWGNSFFFNPDENNMVNAILSMSLKNLNPNFFAYNQFPLFLTFFTTPKHDFYHIALTLRFWSAIFSSFSILFFYLIAKNFFNKNKDLLTFVFLLIFTPGLIQLAHFGTTESVLIFAFSVNLFLAINYFHHPKFKYLLLTALISGMAIGSKITGVFFILPILISLFFVLKEKHNFKKIFFSFLFLSLLTLVFTFIFTPFSFLKFADFKNSMVYETGVATGTTQVFYTRQFLHTIPYLFQLRHIFPYTSGIFMFVFSFIGLFFFIRNKQYLKKDLIIILLPCLIYFLYNGQLFIKWTRFMSPLFFITPLFTVFFLSKIKSKIIYSILFLLAIIPGIYFCRRYFLIDNRPIASVWLINQVPSTSLILSESGNIINLPIYNSNLQVDNFDFYNLDSNLELPSQLTNQVLQSDYILIPSRRVFKNQNNFNFPFSEKYYQSLFSGQLDFTKIRQFNYHLSLFLNDENAEETWSVFDNPTIRIYKKD